MRTSEYTQLDATALAGLVKSGEVTPEELLDLAVGALNEVEPIINAVPILDEEPARRHIAQGLPNGPLKGVPFLLKNLGVEYEGTETNGGSRLFEGTKATRNSAYVQRLLDSGAVIFGKTSTPEFGLTVTTEPELGGATRNPYSPAHSAGGSSGGAGAVVAARVVPVAHASDGGGSIRIPAACNGLFGLKPSRGRTPMGPAILEGWSGCSISHVVSRSVRDSALFLDVLSGPEAGAPYAAVPFSGSFFQAAQRPPGQLRVGVSVTGPRGVEPDPQVRRAVEGAAKTLEGLGHIVEEQTPDIDAEECASAFLVIITSEIRSLLPEWGAAVGRDALEFVEPLTKFIYEFGGRYGADDYARARRRLVSAGQDMAKYHETYDVYVSPVLAQPPAELGTIIPTADRSPIEAFSAVGAYSPHTALFNMSGQPAMSVPLGMSDDGRPIGVMMVASAGREDVLLQVANQLEGSVPWAQREPKVMARGA